VLPCTLCDLFGDIAGLSDLGLLLLHVGRDNGIIQAGLGLQAPEGLQPLLFVFWRCVELMVGVDSPR
jgi:hypothetical protein